MNRKSEVHNTSDENFRRKLITLEQIEVYNLLFELEKHLKENLKNKNNKKNLKDIKDICLILVYHKNYHHNKLYY